MKRLLGMIRLFLFLAASLFAAAAQAAGSAPPCALSYRFTPMWDTTPRRFEIEMSFGTGDRGMTELHATPEWAGITDFERAIRDVRPGEGASAVTQAPGDSKVWRVTHAPGARVTVKYDLVNDVANVDAETALQHRDFFRPMLGGSFFQIFGWAALLLPDLDDEVPLDACVTFVGMPEDWTFASSLGIGQRDGAARIRTHASPLSLRQAVYLGGDFRLQRREIPGGPVVVALRGDWKFDDAKLADATASVVRTQREFWDDDDFPPYLVSLLPNRVAQGSSGGTAVDNAFAMHASADMVIPGADFEHLVAHEHLHTWIPRRIGGMGAEGPEAERYWFSEGFTDYLTNRLLVKSGVWGLNDYARAMNDTILRYESSPARNVTNAAILAGFWKDQAIQRMPYLRGHLVALRWSNALRAQGDTLEAALRELHAAWKRAPTKIASHDHGDLATTRLVARLRESLGPQVDRDVASFIEAGETVPVDADFLGPCFSGREVTKPRWELGFDRRASFESRKITGLVPGSAAEKAGLRDGMPIAGWSVYGGDIDRKVLIQAIGEDGKVRDIEYVPHAAQGIRLFEFAAREDAMREAACRHWVAADPKF